MSLSPNVTSHGIAGSRQLTDALHRLQVVWEAGNAAEALAIVRSLVPEYKAPDMAGLLAAVLEPVTI